MCSHRGTEEETQPDLDIYTTMLKCLYSLDAKSSQQIVWFKSTEKAWS